MIAESKLFLSTVHISLIYRDLNLGLGDFYEKHGIYPDTLYVSPSIYWELATDAMVKPDVLDKSTDYTFVLAWAMHKGSVLVEVILSSNLNRQQYEFCASQLDELL